MSSLGEIFNVAISAEDHSGNSKDAVYSYYRYPSVAYPSNVIVADLDPVKDTLSSFASVNRITNGSPTVQQFSLVMRNADHLCTNCLVNFNNNYNFSSSLLLSLTDSTNGEMVYAILMFLQCIKF